jgi:hypothetical protein
MSARSKTDPGPPTPHDVGYKADDRPNEAMLDRALEAVPRRLAPVPVESQDSAGQEAARYRAEPKVLPRGIDTLPPQEAVIVQTQRDFPTDPTSRNVDNRPPPVTTDPTRSIPKPQLWPIAVGLLVLIALVATVIRAMSTQPARSGAATRSAAASASAPVTAPATAPSATPATQPSPPVMVSTIPSAKPAPTTRPTSSVRATPPSSTVRSAASDDDFSPTMKRP